MSYEYSKKCEKFLLKKIFNNENSLKIFQCLSELYFCNLKEINNLVSNINIHSLSLKSADFISAFSFFKYTPNLKIFNLITTTSYLHDKLDKDLDLSKIKLEKLYLTLKIDASDSLIGGRQFRLLINLIKQFSSSLIYLSLNLSVIKIGTYNDIQFNGIQLQQQLLESMIQLKQFHLYANLWDYLLDIKSILSTFENQFWFDHNWSIGMHGHYLYTLPFHFDKLYDFIDFDDIKSNNSNILNYPWTWYHVTSINFSSSSKLNLNLIKQLKIKMPNLISITFNSFSFPYFETTKDSSISDDKLQKIDITLDSVTTVQFEDESMKDIKQWILDILPNLKHLILSGTTQFFPQTNRFWQYTFDFVFYEIVEAPLVVIAWRGLYNLSDLYIYPDNKLISMLISFTIGYSFFFLLALLQIPIIQCLIKYHHNLIHIFISNLCHLIAFVSVVQIWRSLWMMCDEYINIPGYHQLTLWLCYIGAYILLTCGLTACSLNGPGGGKDNYIDDQPILLCKFDYFSTLLKSQSGHLKLSKGVDLGPDSSSIETIMPVESPYRFEPP
ncbi:unnamed protein product [Rotaria sordida]|uniref:Transmembrane protein n=2 Tax=Rotaria sordida TaxID=392033 RepID=A0A815EYW9_9BILA|nr:unnamed protein product [Rotaria sordida]